VLAHYGGGFVERPTLAPEMQGVTLSETDIEALLAFLQSLESASPEAPETGSPR